MTGMSAEFLTSLVGQAVKVHPEKGLGRKFVGKLTSVEGDPADPVLVVQVGSTEWRTPWSDIDRVQVDASIVRT